MGESLRWPIPVILTAVTTLSLVPAAFSSYDSVDNAEQILSTLASVQAAAFAIVFSVIILGIQLSTSRYATRLADLFRSDAVYKKTVGVFGLSILLDITALTLVNDVSNLAIRYLVSAAIILAIISFFILYFFVDRILEQTTPEGIIKRVKQELTPSQIVADAKAADSDSSETDPFLVLVSIIRSAIDDRDVPAATRGLNVIDSQVGELLKYVTTDQLEDDTPVGDSVEELCTIRLHSAGEKAVEEDLDEVGTESVSTISSIGCDAVDQEHEPVVVHSSEGLTNLVGTVDFDITSERVRKKAVDDSGEMLKEAAETGLWDGAGTGIRLLGWRAAQSVIRRGPTEIQKLPYGSLAMNYIPDVFEEVVDDGSDSVDEHQFFQVTRRDRDRTTSKEWALWSCYASMAEITSAFIRFEIEHEEEIVDWTYVGVGWRDCLSTLSESSLDSILRYWVGTVLYLEYVEFEVDSQMMSGFRSVMEYSVSRELMKKTIDSILAGDIQPQNRINRLPGRINPVKMPRTGASASPILDPGYDFKDWLGQMRGNYLAMVEGEGRFPQGMVNKKGGDS